LIVSLALLSACTTLPDFLVCANMGSSGYCRSYSTHKPVEIDNAKKEYVSTITGKKLKWADVVASSVLIPADQFVKLKQFLDNYCHENPGSCPAGVGDWQGMANDIASHLKI
jgi:hypothetical protein